MNRREFLTTGALLAAGSRLAAAPRVYRAGVFGHTGRGNYGHGLDTCFNRIPTVALSAVADPDDRGRAAALKRLKIDRGFASLEQMLAEAKLDLLSIGPRWVERKLEYLTLAAKHEVHVYMEKPVAGSLEEADAIADLLAKTGIKVVVAHQMRVCPPIVHLKKLADAGTFGRLLEVRTRGKEDRRSGGEDLMVLGTHCLYLMRLFAGVPLWCEATVTQDGRPISIEDRRAATEPLGPVAGDTIHARYGFADNVRGSFASVKGHQAPGGRFSLTLRFEKGVAHLPIDTNPVVQYRPDPTWEPDLKDPPSPLPDVPINDHPSGLKGADACNIRIVEELLRIVEKPDRSPVDFVEARATLEMIFAVYAAHLAGGRIEFPLKDRKHPLGSL